MNHDQSDNINSMDILTTAKEQADCHCDKDACNLCGLMFAGSLFPELNIIDEDKAIAYFEMAIENGSEDAILHLIHAYLTGKIAGQKCAIKPNFEKWLALCEILSEKGNQFVSYSIAHWLAGISEPGEDVSEIIKQKFKLCPDKAIYFLRLACRGRNVRFAKSALELLELALTHGLGNIKKNPERLKKILQEEKEAGNQFL